MIMINDNLQMIRAKASTPEIVKHWLTECHEPTLEKLDLKGMPGRTKDREKLYIVSPTGEGQVFLKRKTFTKNNKSTKKNKKPEKSYAN